MRKRSCTYCKEDKELTKFSIKKNGLYGRNSICKSCVKKKAELRKQRTKSLLTNGNLPKSKVCSKCNIEKKHYEFAQDINKSDGLYSSCKSCNEEYVKSYRRNNKVKVAESKKKAVAKKAEYYANYKNNWYSENKEDHNKRGKEYYEQNKEAISEQQRQKHLEKRKRQLESYAKIKSKKCKKCHEVKSRDNFRKQQTGKYGLADQCKFCRKQSQIDTKERKRLHKIKYYKENKEVILARTYDWKKKKLKTDPVFKLKTMLSHRVRRAIYDQRAVKSAKTLELLGGSIENVRRHLENQFREGMNWENHGNHGWHIDHIKPCSSFDLTNPEEQKKCFHYTNLQPLWAKENLSKGNRDSWRDEFSGGGKA